jgi:hypothetical protein
MQELSAEDCVNHASFFPRRPGSPFDAIPWASDVTRDHEHLPLPKTRSALVLQGLPTVASGGRAVGSNPGLSLHSRSQAAVLYLIRVILRLLLSNRAHLVAENFALRQQLALLRRNGKRPRLGQRDRIFWVWLSRL